MRLLSGILGEAITVSATAKQTTQVIQASARSLMLSAARSTHPDIQPVKVSLSFALSSSCGVSRRARGWTGGASTPLRSTW